jgi:integrase
LFRPPSIKRASSPGRAENTLRGYRADWRDFCVWCESRALSPLPASPETVAAYIAECAGRLKVGSIQRRLKAIAEAHKATARNTLKGIRRALGAATEPKAPTLTDDIRAMVDACDAGLIGARDRALMLLGFAGAFRRSELVGLDISDCAFGKDGLTVTLRRSKTDQDGAGGRSESPTDRIRRRARCARSKHGLRRRARKRGRCSARSPGTGRFRRAGCQVSLSGIDVARVVKKLAVRAGLDPAKYAGHSLRAGHASAAIAGHRNGPSLSKRGIGVCRWSGGTSGMVHCFAKTAPGSWACNPIQALNNHDCFHCSEADRITPNTEEKV